MSHEKFIDGVGVWVVGKLSQTCLKPSPPQQQKKKEEKNQQQKTKAIKGKTFVSHEKLVDKTIKFQKLC